jgi:hypothetical protein
MSVGLESSAILQQHVGEFDELTATRALGEALGSFCYLFRY